jgi:hypothetical protein
MSGKSGGVFTRGTLQFVAATDPAFGAKRTLSGWQNQLNWSKMTLNGRSVGVC